jgi:hypothetical protein
MLFTKDHPDHPDMTTLYNKMGLLNIAGMDSAASRLTPKCTAILPASTGNIARCYSGQAILPREFDRRGRTNVAIPIGGVQEIFQEPSCKSNHIISALALTTDSYWRMPLSRGAVPHISDNLVVNGNR